MRWRNSARTSVLPAVAEDNHYTIPGSGGVLRNKLGLITQADVDRAMNISASAEWAILQLEPIPERLDLDYLRSIHRRFMSPVLDWAEARLSAAFRVGGEQVLSNYLQMRLLPPSRSATLRFTPE